MHYNSLAHAWRSQEKAITPFGLEFYFKFQSKWAIGDTNSPDMLAPKWDRDKLVITPEFILLPLLLLQSLTMESKLIKMNSWRLNVQKFQRSVPFTRVQCFCEWICSL